MQRTKELGRLLALVLCLLSGTAVWAQTDARGRDCDGCPEMVMLPAGSFTMGSPGSEAGRWPREGPRHTVTIAHPFAVGRFEVTRGEFARFVRETGYTAGGGCYFWSGSRAESQPSKDWRSPGFWQTERDPVVCVSWLDAKAYTRWLAAKTGKPYRLLTEAEWEYAARAGTQTSRPWGDDPDEACVYASVADFAARSIPGSELWKFHNCDDRNTYTAPAGTYMPNGFGLYDMIGNAWEWVEDCWHEDYTGAPNDGSAWVSADCSQRVMRGGGWVSVPDLARSASRGWDAPGDRGDFRGFRVARTQ
ncbi:MAG TPA: formylglycine-generating enzyme family protein [Burkholderiales bacterium]|nr:formylglycine-generating enzyme family protein [Burkholderiales bacterium]